jgi:DnaJ-class molecular chaperone
MKRQYNCHICNKDWGPEISSVSDTWSGLCDECKSKGYCSHCNGWGWFWAGNVKMDCSHCNGTGKIKK